MQKEIPVPKQEAPALAELRHVTQTTIDTLDSPRSNLSDGSSHQGSCATLGAPTDLQPFDSNRFQFQSVLMENLRGGSRIELYLDADTGMIVACKRIPSRWLRESSQAFLSGSAEAENPWQELGLTQRLGSPQLGLVQQGVIACHGAFSDVSGDAMLVMEFLSGGDLFALVGSMGPPGPAREAKAWPLVRSLLMAVLSLHGHGVAHGDVSCENALLRGPNSQVVLIDFEFALDKNLERAVGSRGKPSYQAPEMHSQLPYDARAADLFACGVTAFCLAVGNYPWASTRPGKCSAFSYLMSHGVQAFLDKKLIRLADGTRGPPVRDLLSPEYMELLSILLNPAPSRRFEVVSFEASSFELLAPATKKKS